MNDENQTESNENVSQATPSSEDQSLADLVSQYVGPDKKFKSLQSALESISHKDSFIEQLKSEKQQVMEDKEQVNQRLTDLLATQKEVKPEAHSTPTASQTSQASQEPDIESLIDRRLQERETKAQREKNMGEAKRFLTDTFGDKAESTVREVAEANGTSVDYLLDLASVSTQLFKDVFSRRAPEAKRDPNVVSGTLSSERAEFQRTTPRSEYEELLKSNVKKGLQNTYGRNTENWQRLVALKKQELAAGRP